jgi:hypothetical protein
MLENPRPSLRILVKNGHNNGGRGGENVPPGDVCARDGREEGGAQLVAFVLWSITSSSNQKPVVIAQHHCRFKPGTGSDMDFHCWFLRIPNHFLIFKLRTSSEDLSLRVLEKPAVKIDSVVLGL